MARQSGGDPGRAEQLRGTLESMVLRVLADGPDHGYGIGLSLERALDHATAHRGRLAVPRVVPAGTPRPHPGIVGPQRHEPARPLLLADPQGPGGPVGSNTRVVRIFARGLAVADGEWPVIGRRRRRGGLEDESRKQVREELAFSAEMRAREGRASDAPLALEDHLVRVAQSHRRRVRLKSLGNELIFDSMDAVRRLRRAPAFALGAIAIVALGLGANSAVFSVENATFLTALPFADADRLVRVQEYSRAIGGATRWVDGSGASLLAMRDCGAFSSSAALNPIWTALAGGGDVERIAAGAVTAGWFSAIGVTPAFGRAFTPDEERAGDGVRVAVISDRLWHERYGGRSDVLGASLSIDGSVRTIVGVLRPGYRFPYDEDAWWPATVQPNVRGLFLAGRLAPGVSFEEASSRLAAQGPRLLLDYAAVMHGNVPGIRRFRDILIGDEGRVMFVLAWAVAVLLLIVAGNVTMLFITRIVSRERELAVRAALGCGRGRQIRHLILESLMVFAAGGVLGLGVAALAARALISIVPHVLVEQTGMTSIAFDWRVLSVTTLLALVCGSVVGGVSAWRAPRTDLREALTAVGANRIVRRRPPHARGARRGRAGAGRSADLHRGHGCRGLHQLQARDVGFRTDDLLTWHVELGTPRFHSAAAHLALVDRIAARLGPVAGPAGVGMSTVNPLCCGDWGSQMAVDGQPVTATTANAVNWRLVMPSYFSALGYARSQAVCSTITTWPAASPSS